MSMIAMVLLAGITAAAPPRTAQSILEAHRAKTSIGPDPCRSQDPEEIVVCARDRDEFSTLLDDANKYEADGDPASRYGGERVDQMQAIADAQCRAQGFGCARGSINVLAVGKFVVAGIKALLGGDD